MSAPMTQDEALRHADRAFREFLEDAVEPGEARAKANTLRTAIVPVLALAIAMETQTAGGFDAVLQAVVMMLEVFRKTSAIVITENDGAIQ